MKIKICKNLIMVVSLVLLFHLCLKAQVKSDTTNKHVMVNKTAIDANFSQFQNDMGVGFSLTSPFLDGFALRLRGNVQGFEALLPGETNMSLTGYYSIRLGAIFRKYVITNKLDVYMEPGLVLLFPNSKFSSKINSFASYALIAAEMQVSNHESFFFEMGLIGANTRADKIAGEPFYANGFLLSAGYRIYL